MSQSLPALLEELHRNLNSVDITVETLCLVMVRQAVSPKEPPQPGIGELVQLCGLLQLVRENVTKLECYCEP